MSVINTNVKSIVAQNALTVNNRAMSKTMEQLSTGKRINGAADDAAGLAISSKMTSQIKGLNQAVRNANDGISLLQTAEGAMVETTNMMQRMRELAVQSANDTNTDDDRTALNLEFQQLKQEINRIGDNTQWNGTAILNKSFGNDTGKFNFQVGANANQVISADIADMRTSSARVDSPALNPVLTTPGQDSRTAQAQTSEITIAGSLTAGDVFNVSINGGTAYSATAGASPTAADSVDDLVTAINAGTSAGQNHGVTASNVSGKLKLTGASAGTAFTATVSKTGTGTISDPTTVNGETALTASAQKTTLSLTGTFKAGDKIDIPQSTNKYTVTGKETDLSSAFAAAVTADTAAAAKLTATGSNGTVVLTSKTADLAGAFTAPALTLAPAAAAPALAMLDTTAITDKATSNTAITNLDSGLKVINESRAALGSAINRLTYAADNLTNVSQNTSASRSRIMDTDYAQATTELARTQIISQAATAMLAQANQAPQSVLSLLR